MSEEEQERFDRENERLQKCSTCDSPADWIDWSVDDGQPFCNNCRREDSQKPFPEPIDLRSLMAGDPPETHWLIKPIVRAGGKSTTIVASRGVGKSLLLLEGSCAKATGEPFLGQPAGDPIHVVHFDLEMGPEDLYSRLADLGYHDSHPLFHVLVGHLHYFQLIDLPPLDTKEGGIAVEMIVNRYKAGLVVIDSINQTIEGEENPAETWRNLFAYTGRRLKKLGIPVIKADNFGKDTGRGARGNSAKEDREDVIWEMKPGKVEGDFTLKATKWRMEGSEPEITIRRVVSGDRTTHLLFEHELIPRWIQGLADRLDELGLPVDASVRDTAAALRKDGKGRRQSDVNKVAKFRKARHEHQMPA